MSKPKPEENNIHLTVDAGIIEDALRIVYLSSAKRLSDVRDRFVTLYHHPVVMSHGKRIVKPSLMEELVFDTIKGIEKDDFRRA